MSQNLKDKRHAAIWWNHKGVNRSWSIRWNHKGVNRSWSMVRIDLVLVILSVDTWTWTSVPRYTTLNVLSPESSFNPIQRIWLRTVIWDSALGSPALSRGRVSSGQMLFCLFALSFLVELHSCQSFWWNPWWSYIHGRVSDAILFHCLVFEMESTAKTS